MHKDFTPSDVMKLVRDKEIVFVDLRFMDFPGMQQHFTVPAAELKESIFEDGLGFDGSSIRGWQAINESDMLLSPMKAKASIGYLPETPPVYPEMTVKEYLRFCCDLKGVLKADQAEHIDEISELTGLKDIQSRLIANLSKGYRQRTGLAQALCGG
ncbi:MAG TPA: glutamine synthetase beta-grasp domain-containing protein, partial [Candidatus Hydrogenedentes bacterium]|nr:glutamine synthetase beta-grasp domain-containing protein [Candidatus Hydrogenedentota bacterium]